MTSWHSFPKVWSIGHPRAKELFLDPVNITEKIDGSQYSFGVFDGELKCKSKNKEIILDAPDKMFTRAIETSQKLLPLLNEGWTYRGEYLQSPHHGSLSYLRCPREHVILFDINTNEETYLPYDQVVLEAERLGLEAVPLLYEGKVENPETLLAFLERESILGGAKIEGIVCKNYNRFTPDGKALMGKYVCEAFRERNKAAQLRYSQPSGDAIAHLTERYKTEARWNKAIQHLRERGELTDSPKDIGALIKEIQSDVKTECEDEIKEFLFNWAWKKINGAVVSGFPEYYKNKLLEKQFE